MNTKIKVCPDPHCEAVYHNVPNKGPHYCNDCGHRIIEINTKTYLKKFADHYFQYDYLTGDLDHSFSNQIKQNTL